MKTKPVVGYQLSVARLRMLFSKRCSGLAAKMILATGFIALLPSLVFAQTDTTQAHAVDMATTMRSNGKIYVVVAVLVIILLGLFLYLIRLDRKIGKLEKE